MKKRILFILILAIFILGELMSINTFAMRQSEEAEFAEGQVTVVKLNVRKGPGKKYEVIGSLSENEGVKIYAKLDDWYIIQTKDDIIGCVSSEYIKQAEGSIDTINDYKPEPVQLTEDEKNVLELINNQRIDNGLEALEINDELQNVVRIKAKDMVDNEYFAHESPTYGSPFDMMKNNQINYRVAGENIAGNSDNQKAVEAWMNSESHKNNILNNSYNYTGIAVVQSPKYGKIFVQMFIGK
ncbi:MAG: SH3 domain-containing protein [Clostridia bacterium]|nr:SH3 domain-containing protein [Clostridia bacterium]